MRIIKYLWPMIFPLIVAVLFIVKYKRFLSEFPAFYLPRQTEMDGYGQYRTWYLIAVIVSLFISFVMIRRDAQTSKKYNLSVVVLHVIFGGVMFYIAFMS